MRRTLAALTATAVLVPLAVTAAPGAASAATNTLTVTAIGRDGVKVKTRVSVINLGTRAVYDLTSGKARTLPRGTYAALANVPTAKDGSSTVGGRIIKVSGASATTIDARKGKPLRVSLSPAPAHGSAQYLRTRVCTRFGQSGAVDAGGAPGSLYMIPATSENLRFSYLSQWTEPSASGALSDFLSAGTAKGIPVGYSKTVKRSGMAKIAVNLRSGPTAGTEATLRVSPATEGCAGGLDAGARRDRLPYRTTAHVVPGRWNLETYSDTGVWTDVQSRDRTYEAGKSYSQTFFRSTWAPGGRPPSVVRKYLSFDTGVMFVDPSFSQGTSSALYHVGGSSKSTVTLTRGGKILKQQNRPNRYGDAFFTYKVPSAGWYNLKVDARRHDPDVSLPADLLSNRSIAQFHFYADPAKDQLPPVRLIRIVPDGLDLRNSAKPGSVTPVNFALLKHDLDPDAKPVKMTVKTVAAQASYDGGKTWKTATVKKSGGGWVATVKNPKSGYVSLRVKITDTKGNASQITVSRAYRIA